MKEVKKCSISGIAFTLDADAYALLSRYLDSLKATYAETADGDEIVADIEARIAELILSQQENSRVVETPLLRQIISQMGTAEDISSVSNIIQLGGTILKTCLLYTSDAADEL